VRNPHNDYLQLVAEVGVIGCLLFAWLLVEIGRVLCKALGRLSPFDRPTFAGLVPVFIVVGVHELFDFNLHIPANAFLFTLIAGLAVRISSDAIDRAAIPTDPPTKSPVRVMPSAFIAMGCVVLFTSALVQRAEIYPYDVRSPRYVSQAVAQVVQHPASAQAHEWLGSMGDAGLTDDSHLRELATAVFLEPTNPSFRDSYASELFRLDKDGGALKQVEESVSNAPTLDLHYYLNPALLLWLLPQERSSIETGFKRAIAADYPGALASLGRYYELTGRFSEESQLYACAATRRESPAERALHFRWAGMAAIAAGDRRMAESLLQESIGAFPSETQGYEELVANVYGPAGDMRAAQAAVNEGLRRGADPVPLYMVLARAAQAKGDQALVEEALTAAVNYEASFTVLMQVGQIYMNGREYDRASGIFQRAAELDPTSGEVFFSLGLSEEREYQYSAAEKSYARASELAPERFRTVYLQFRERMQHQSLPS
jgi:tetratricopeptide (TPR) repeat protein